MDSKISQLVIDPDACEKPMRKPRMLKTEVKHFRDWLDTDDRYMLKPRIIQQQYKNEYDVDLLPNFIRTTKRALIRERGVDNSKSTTV